MLDPRSDRSDDNLRTRHRLPPLLLPPTSTHHPHSPDLPDESHLAASPTLTDTQDGLANSADSSSSIIRRRKGQSSSQREEHAALDAPDIHDAQHDIEETVIDSVRSNSQQQVRFDVEHDGDDSSDDEEVDDGDHKVAIEPNPSSNDDHPDEKSSHISVRTICYLLLIGIDLYNYLD